MSAAKISPHIKGVTIGPQSQYTVVAVQPTSNPYSWSSKPQYKNTHKNISVIFNNSLCNPNPLEKKNADQSSLSKVDRIVKITDYMSVKARTNLEEIEKQRRLLVKKEMELRQLRLNDMERKRNAMHNENLQKGQLNAQRKIRENEQEIIEAIKNEEKLAKEFEEKQKLDLKEQKKRALEQKFKLKEEEDKRQKEKTIKDLFHKTHNECHLLHQEILKKINEVNSNTINNGNINLNSMYEHFQKQSHELGTQELNTTKYISEDIKKLAVIKNGLIDFSKKFDEEIKPMLIQQYEREKNEKLAKQKKEVQQYKEITTNETTTEYDKDIQSCVTLVGNCASFSNEDCNNQWIELMNFGTNYEKAIEPLINDGNCKKYRFDCQRAINIPVNAISGVNSEHLVDKYNKLFNLLSLNVVKIGDTNFTAGAHPLGKQFCTNLLAKNFVVCLHS